MPADKCQLRSPLYKYPAMILVEGLIILLRPCKNLDFELAEGNMSEVI